MKDYTEDELDAELRALGTEFIASTSMFTKTLMICNRHAKTRKDFGDIPQPAAAKSQRTDVGGIPGELIQKLATESEFPTAVVQDIASWTVPKMKEILNVLNTPSPSKANMSDLLQY